MPMYSYQGVDSAGTTEAGTLEASCEKLAFDTLQSRGITVFDLTLGMGPVRPVQPWYRRDISLWGQELPYDDQAAVASFLATLFGAGLSAPEVIRIAALSAEKPDIRRQFDRVGQRVADGAAFADAFEAENRLFSPIFVAFLKVSDTTNTLPRLLQDLAQFFQKQNTVRQKVLSALIYPVILVLAGVALLLVVVLYLAPNLAPIFDAVGKEPPGTLSALLALNNGLRNYWALVLAGLAGLCIAALAALQIPGVQALILRVLLRVPVVGRLLRLSALARLSQATELLLSSGQPLSGALRQAAQIMGGASEFKGSFLDAADAIEAGLPASEVFAETRNIPPTFKELFRIAAQTNRLAATLNALSVSLAEQADRSAQRLLTLLTPALTLVLGLGVGLLIYTLMGAILEVNDLAF